MAAGVDIQDSYKTVQVVSNSTVVEIQYILAATTPTGIGFNYPMIHKVWTDGPPYTILLQIADLLEALVTSNHVVAGQAVQDLDANGLIQDSVDLIVQLDRSSQNLPPLQGTANVSMSLIEAWAGDPNIAEAAGLPTVESFVDLEYKRLQALAAT